MPQHEKIVILLLLIGLAQGASATQVTWTDIYAGCDEEMGIVECTTRFLTPSIPFKAFRILVVDSAFAMPDMLRERAGIAGLHDEFSVILSNPAAGLTDVIASIKIVGEIVIRLFLFQLNPLNWASLITSHLWGVVSGIMSFMLVFTLRFVQFYIQISLIWLGISSKLKMDYEGFGDKALVTIVLMFVGSALVLAHDWVNIFSGVIG